MNLHQTLFRAGCALGLALLVAGCETVEVTKSSDAKAPVRKVDFARAPELKELAEHARQFGNEMFPKVCALFADPEAKPPPRFDVIFKPLKSQHAGEAYFETRTIYLNTAYLTNAPVDRDFFDKVFVHEMAHLALQHRAWRWSRSHFGWEEGLADYAYFKLIGTNGVACPQCDYAYPHYNSGYTCAGAFLLYVESLFGTELIHQLNAELRRGRYSDAFFARTTGKSLDELWTEFQKTPPFKPAASEALSLMQELGFKDGKLPNDAGTRFNQYVAHHADDFTKMAVKSVSLDRRAPKDVRGMMAVYLYFSQPGGSAEKTWLDLREKGEVPGIRKGEKGALNIFLMYSEIAAHSYPLTRILTAHKRGEEPDYHYTMVRTAPESEWKLTKAWRAAKDGKVIEEFPVP